MAKFADILQNAPTTLEASVPLPAGEYEIICIKADIGEMPFDFGEEHKKGDEVLNIMFKPTSALDVDEEELEKCENWKNELISLRIFPEEMGDKLCDSKGERGIVYDLGMSPGDFDTVEEMILGMAGNSCLGAVVHAPNKKDPEKPFVNLKQTGVL